MTNAPVLFVTLCLTLVLASGASIGAAPDSYQESECGAQLKTVGTALEVYSTEHQGHYPQALSQLVPRYLPAIPLCPTAKRDTYSAGYQVGMDPDRYRVCCTGTHHFTENLPAYSSEGGLIRGAAAEMAAQSARPYFPNMTAGLPTEGKSSTELEEDYSDAIEAIDGHRYDKAQTALKRIQDSVKPDSPLALKTHGALVWLYALQQKGADADKELASMGGASPASTEVADDLGSDFTRAGDQWTKARDFKRAEKLYHLALLEKAGLKTISRSHVQYGMLLETQRRIPEAVHQYQLALEGSIHWLSQCKQEADKPALRTAGSELEYIGNVYANFLASHGRKPGAAKVRADIKELLQ